MKRGGICSNAKEYSFTAHELYYLIFFWLFLLEETASDIDYLRFSRFAELTPMTILHTYHRSNAYQLLERFSASF